MKSVNHWVEKCLRIRLTWLNDRPSRSYHCLLEACQQSNACIPRNLFSISGKEALKPYQQCAAFVFCWLRILPEILTRDIRFTNITLWELYSYPCIGIRFLYYQNIPPNFAWQTLLHWHKNHYFFLSTTAEVILGTTRIVLQWLCYYQYFPNSIFQKHRMPY